ncbi:hypothetical protein GCM10020227_65390 [Streptomyces flavovirens]
MKRSGIGQPLVHESRSAALPAGTNLFACSTNTPSRRGFLDRFCDVSVTWRKHGCSEALHLGGVHPGDPGIPAAYCPVGHICFVYDQKEEDPQPRLPQAP